MAPVLLLLATHVALALNSNRYNVTDSPVKQEQDNYARQETLPPANASYFQGRAISDTPDGGDEQEFDLETQTWSTSEDGNEVTNFALLDEATEGAETEFTAAQTYNKSIDPGDEPETGGNSINFTKADYNSENNAVERGVARSPQNTTNSYDYQDLNNGHAKVYTNLGKHLQSFHKETFKQTGNDAKAPFEGKKAKINNNETSTSNLETSGGGAGNCSLTNNETSPVNNLTGATREESQCSGRLCERTDFNLIKSLVFEASDSGYSPEIQEKPPTNSPIPLLSTLMNTLKPDSPGSDKTDTRKLPSLQVPNTPPSYVLNKAQRTKDAHRQQNRSISSELIGTGLRFKSTVIKRAHSPPANQSTPSAVDLVNDTARVLNTGLEHPPEPTNSFVIKHHQGILNDSPSRETKSAHHISDAYYQVTTAGPSSTNVYTEPRRAVSESYVNRFTKFPAGENMDAVPVSPTSASHPDTVHQKFQEGLQRKVKKSILQPTREPVTASWKPTDSILNGSSVNLNTENVRSTPIYNPLKRNLIRVDEGLTAASSKIYEAFSLCPNCSNTTDSVSTTAFSSHSDTHGDKLGDVTTDPDLATPKVLDGKKANLSLAGLKPGSTTPDSFFTRLNVSEDFVTVSSRRDKVEKSTPVVTTVSFDDAAEEVLDVYEELLMTTSASDEIVSAFNVTTELSDNDTLVVNISSSSVKVISEFPWPVKKEAVVEGDLVLGGLMMVHEREDTITCGPVMPQGGIQALEAMLYSLDRLNEAPTSLLPNITLGAHILDDCDKDTYGLEMAVDFIKGRILFSLRLS